MIASSDTNFLYLSDLLPKKYSKFFSGLEKALISLQIPFGLLSKTKDIWAVDYMPIQVGMNKFVQFTYNPDYLRNSIKWSKTITDGTSICDALNLNTQKSDILLDGGNVVGTPDKVIMCDKIFMENPNRNKTELTGYLEEVLQVDQIIFIPTDPNDFTGHADGIVRFYDSNTVLINEYSQIDLNYQFKLRSALTKANLECIEVPYNPYCNKTVDEAKGIYLNFLQLKDRLIIPTFDMKEDDLAIKLFEQLFNGYTIAAVDCKEIAREGGVLNCISWNIKAS